MIAPVESKPPDLFDKVWQFDLANNFISIGWRQLGDVSKMSRELLSEAIASSYPEKPPQTKLYGNMIWAFYHESSPGDVVVARRGRKTLAAVGRMAQPAIYTPGKNPATGHPNFLEVAWRDQPRDRSFPGVVFPMPTLAELPEQQYRNLVEGSGIPAVIPEPPQEIEDPSAFGPIDIMAVEHRSHSFVIIELKKGRPSDQVIGQVLRYMGWVKKNLCTDGQVVKGLVIARDADPKLSYALEMTSNIDVRYYSVSFKLRETP